MKRSWVLLGLFLMGCASTGPAPEFFNGNYYLAGDPDCVAYKGHQTQNKIKCYNAGKQETGIRNPMTPQQMAMHQQMQAQSQAQNQLSSNQDHLVAPIQYPTMATPQVTPISRPGGNQVRCIGVGIYANCRAY